ncbi:hypothetical protein DH09_00370 (plasmid) [Bacillaceae bacterium JMAK1]|nr:hypothetical protein DH09_00370 [Bacillaceae bacterium JMAK1]
MYKALREYKQFLKKNAKNLSNYEEKLAKIILDNFVVIEDSPSAGGKRGKLLASLVTNYVDSIEREFILDETSEHITEDKINHLSKLTVKNFRGFSDEHTFEFKNPYTFIYGPNGSGKTSLCEALEFGLLGTIHEADVKRISLDTYIKNAYTGKSDLPLLKGVNSKNNEIDVQPMPQTNEFCFIERNRIEGFARVSANTPQAQQQRLAALFGLEDFNAFVSNFNERFDNYLDCEGILAKKLFEKEKKIALQKQYLETSPQNKEEVSQQTDELLSKYSDINTLEELLEKLSGTEEADGLIQKNNSRIAELGNLKNIPDPGIEKLIENTRHVDSLLKERKKATESLQGYKDQISLKDLYTAILQNKDNFHDVCPACESQLYIDGNLAVPLNPYSHAAEKVQEFELAIQLETRVTEIDRQIPNSLMFIETKLTQILTVVESIEFPKKDTIGALNQQILNSKEDEQNLSDAIATTIYCFNIFNDLKEDLITYNKEVSETEDEIKKLKGENRQLNKALEEISKIQTRIESINDGEKNVKEAMKKFSEENKELINQVEDEKLLVARNCQYRDAYISLKARLIEYNRQLPSDLASNLNNKTMEFYNAINRYDHPYDLLEGITLPSNSGQKIEIRFNNGGNIDALHVLSEGHIRCLGLSILLAKNVQDNLPIVIFDDVVNAIDDEHRLGIIETILENDYIKDKQLIITTHGEEFVKQLENNISKKEYSKKVTRIDFLQTDEPKKITVKLDLPRNYLVIAQQRLDEGQLRDSLAHARRSLEALINKLWKKLTNKYSVHLKVSMRLPGKPPELMSTTQALRKFINTNSIDEFENVASSLKILLGMEYKNPIEWTYLNKGTHEEDRVEEFDRTIVKEMIGILKQIDKDLIR